MHNQTIGSPDREPDNATTNTDYYTKKPLSNTTTTENSIFTNQDQNQVLTIMQRCFPTHFEKKDTKADTSCTNSRSSKVKAFKTDLDAQRLHDKLFYRAPDFL